jgi:hypothetical protein
MRIVENLRLSLRYARMRLLESALAVIGTTLGVAVIAAAVTLIQTYNAGVNRELASPVYHFIEIEPISAGNQGDVAIARLGPVNGREVPRLALADIDLLKAEVPLASQVFASEHQLSSEGATFAVSVSKAGPAGGNASIAKIKGAGGMVVQGTPREVGNPDVATPMDEPTVDPPTLDAPGSSMPPDARAGVMTFSSSEGGPVGGFMEGPVEVPAEPALTATLTPLVDEYDVVRLTNDGFSAWGVSLARGSLFTSQDAARGTPALVLGADLARRMFGDTDPVGGRFKRGDTVWTVVGVLAPLPYFGPEKTNPNAWAFAPFQQPAIRLPDGTSLRLPERVRSLTVAVKDTAQLRAALDQVTTFIEKHYGPESYAAISNLAEAEQSRINHNRLFVVIGFLAAAALFISSITLLNLMTTRTLRRSRSIGIFRSLGARRGDIFAIFLGESLSLTVLGGLLGAVLAPFLYQLLLTQLIPASWGVDLAQGFDWLVMALALLGAVILNLVFGLFPAAQAARTRVVEAIRAE